MAFATVEDVTQAQRKDADPSDVLTIEYLLDVATEMIKGYCDQTIELVTDDEVTVRSQGGGIILLPELPVVSVGAVVSNDETLVLDADYEVHDYGIIRSLSGNWLYPVTVTYTHGYEDIPADIKGVCVDIVKRAFENPAGLQRDDLNTASQWLGFTAENKAVLDRRYKLHAV